ncbi:hypothetical protein AAEX28_04960 [Lentisphaerota bacterium WC36G]|nr:hypothetical protein LJT99_02485 [Lentisphaerae bacterium WC36]UDQ98890.1 hypothetical protein LJT99_04975 [Lentisphaerae bacterium WC36]UDQ99438.1 hypothetical protein LJT99_07815 [Lentisphaerae bacterium WC36]
MLKLHASYSKKVPAEEKYSSHSFHASVEVELPDGLAENELQNRIHQTFKMVRNSVENEIRNPNYSQQNNSQNQINNQNPPQQNASNDVASPKQIKYLLDLLNQSNTPIQNVINRFNVNSLQELTRKQCSQLIDESQ